MRERQSPQLNPSVRPCYSDAVIVRSASELLNETESLARFVHSIRFVHLFIPCSSLVDPLSLSLSLSLSLYLALSHFQRRRTHYRIR